MSHALSIRRTGLLVRTVLTAAATGPVQATTSTAVPSLDASQRWRRAVKQIAITALLSCPLLLGTPAFARWSTSSNENNAISTAAGEQTYPAITSDGAGGAIITWHSGRDNLDIYAQRIDAAGFVKWTANGVAISTAARNQVFPGITSDGAGGAYITWLDDRSGVNNIYAQRVNSNGVPQWTTNGIAIGLAADYQLGPVITSDGTGGALIAWEDGDRHIYAQRIDANGSRWTPNGVRASAEGDNAYAAIVSDGAGGAIISWIHAARIYAQHINGSGGVRWAPTGVPVTPVESGAGFPGFSSMTTDGAGGAIIAWWRYPASSSSIFAQRIDAAGSVRWAPNGVPMTNTVYADQGDPVIASDGAGGAIIAWQDDRGGDFSYDIYAQRVNSDGIRQWGDAGAAVSTAEGVQWHASIVSDGAGGAIITWEDGRGTFRDDIYAQRIDAAGVVKWTRDGVAISTAASYQMFRQDFTQFRSPIVSIGAGCAIITWLDFRNVGNNTDIYAQQINGDGVLGDPCTGCVQPPSGMVAWWRFDEGAGATSFQDVLGGNSATPLASPVSGAQAPQAVSGTVNGAIHFQKFGNQLSGAQVSPRGDLASIGSGDFTIDAWVRFPTAAAGNEPHYIVNRFDSAQNKGYALYVTSPATNERLEFKWGDGANVGTVQTMSVLPPGPWHHVAVTLARNVGGYALDIRLFVDGLQQGQLSGNPPSLGSLANSRVLDIGRQPSTFDEPITIDELEIFKVALRQSDIQSIYNAGSAGKCQCTGAGQSVDLTVIANSTVFGVGNGVGATVSRNLPVTINYSTQGCFGHEVFLLSAVNAPPVLVRGLSYYDGITWQPLPTSLSLITPFVTGGPTTSDGTHTLYSGPLPAGDYSVLLACDAFVNGHLDITSLSCFSGAFDYLPLRVQ